MQVTEAGLKKFIELYCEEFGEEISVPDARIMASELLSIVKVICRPINKKHKENNDD